jgi:glycosyltransferase involved in cell wall biosynthesis
MASSLPIIAWEKTLPSDVLIDGKNGFFIKNPSELAEKMSIILSDRELQVKMGSESRRMVEKFDWENIVTMIIDEYNKCRTNVS